jgi:tetratricopeptide (TPR) repeat protein
MIVRDSARTLRACLAGIAPWVDEMVVVDTGSQDDTREIAREHGAQVFEFPWCDDFSAARNESLRHASGDWLFWMDSDDTIQEPNGRRLRELADQPLEAGPAAYVFQVHCPGPPGSVDVTVVDHVKLFRNDPRLRFEGRIHEQILPALRRIDGEVCWTDIFVEHSGTDHSPDAHRRKQTRDLRLLEMELADRPGHPFVLFNLGMTYADMEEFEAAADYLCRCVEASTPDESHLRKAYALLAGVLLELGRLAEARSVLDQALAIYEYDAELCFRLGVLAQREKEYGVAIQAYEDAIANRADRHFSSRDEGITSYKARHNLAGVYRDIQRPDLAELQWRLALDKRPQYLAAWNGLVDSLLSQRKLATLEVALEHARLTGKIAASDLIEAEARLCAASGFAAQAFKLIDNASLGAEDSTHLLRLKCQLLFESGKPEAAIGELEELCRLDPDDGANWHNLGTAQQQAGHLALSVSSFYRSLAVRPDAIQTLVQLGHAQHALQRPEAANRAWQIAEDLASRNRLAEGVQKSECLLQAIDS